VRGNRLLKNTSTFADNMDLPIHRWYRFPAGFSAEWVRHVISNSNNKSFDNKAAPIVFDPFVGCGATVLAAEQCAVPAIGIDSHPFIVRIAQTKLNWRSDLKKFRSLAAKTLRFAKNLPESNLVYPKLIHACYSKENLKKLDKLRRSWLHFNDESPLSDLVWLTLVCILRRTSHAGTAPWQYVLPNRKKKNVAEPFSAFMNQARIMIEDMQHFQVSSMGNPKGRILRDDARICSSMEKDSVDLVITSPPYPNNYDYADATRLEMSFFGEIERWADLKDKVRRYLIRSCSQHMSSEDELTVLLKKKALDPIKDKLRDVCALLEKERLKHSTKKKYHLMIAAYFSDLADVWVSLRRVCKEGAKVCFIVGDSAPHGIYIPVDTWLGELAKSAGFNSYVFEKIRDRNIKWNSNRKHKIPLKEGRLWVKG